MIYVRFYGGNGYCGCDYEEYEAFSDNYPVDMIDDYSNELAYDNAETFEYVVTGWGEDWESEEDRDWYYETALDYCGWDYCSQEEYEENQQ